MPYPKFVALADLIGPYIKKQDTSIRISIPASERLALTKRFLETGKTFHSLSFQFRIGKATVSGIVTEVCAAIYAVLRKDFLQTRKQAKRWTEIAEQTVQLKMEHTEQHCGHRWKRYSYTYTETFSFRFTLP